MATTSPTGRVFPLPDLVGFKAAHAIATLRELGLTPVPLPALVSDVAEAGFVLGLDPPPSSQVRPKTRITISVATHPDYDGRAEAEVDQDTPSVPVQPPLGWPRSAPTGLAQPEPEFDPRAFDATSQTAAVPPAPSAPASTPPDAAPMESPLDVDSSADPFGGAAAPPAFDDFSASVPTPDEYAAQDEWDRIRAEEAAGFAGQHAPSDATAPAPETDEAPIVDAELVDVERERAAEEEARRAARRRSARRYRRLTLKQKLMVGGVLLVTLVLIIAAASGHKKPSRAQSATAKSHTPTHTTAAKPPVAAKVTKPKGVSHKPHVKVRVRTRTRTKVVTVTVSTPTRAPVSASTPSTASAPASKSSYTAPASTPTYTAPVTHTTATRVAAAPTTATRPASTTTSSKPASSRESADPSSSGTGGGSTLQSPDGAIAPPNPSQP